MIPVLIALQWTLFIMAPIVDYSFPENAYPPELNAFLNREGEKEYGSFFTCYAVATLFLYIIGSIGMCKLKKWGFVIYIIAQIALLSAIPLVGYNLSSGYSGVLYESSMMVIGATIMLGYLKIWKSA